MHFVWFWGHRKHKIGSITIWGPIYLSTSFRPLIIHTLFFWRLPLRVFIPPQLLASLILSLIKYKIDWHQNSILQNTFLQIWFDQKYLKLITVETSALNYTHKDDVSIVIKLKYFWLDYISNIWEDHYYFLFSLNVQITNQKIKLKVKFFNEMSFYWAWILYQWQFLKILHLCKCQNKIYLFFSFAL